MAEASRLEPMVGQVLAYGEDHRDEFGSYGLVWHGDGDASVFISLTSRLDTHRAALQGIVDFPDELVVCQVAVSGEIADRIIATLSDELAGRFLELGRAMGTVHVGLDPDEEALAEELLARYGDAITVTIGALPYPLDDATSICTAPPQINRLPGLEIRINPPRRPLTTAGGGPLRLTVTLTNVGDSPIEFVSGTATGTILDPDGNVVSANNIGIADVGISIDLDPGESTRLRLLASISSCDPQLGYRLPPGDYQIIAEVQGPNTTLHSEPMSIVIGS